VDAADWLLIDPLLAQGRLPHLASLLERGVRADLHTLTPMLSPLLWTSIATGTTADRHGILDFLTPDPSTGKMVPVTSALRREPALWNYLTQDGIDQAVIGWLATWPAETVTGHLVTDRFGFLAFAGASGGSREEGMTWPPEYVERARELEVDPTSLPPEFWRRFFDLPTRELTGLGGGGYRKGDLVQNFALTVATALTSTAIAADLQRSPSPRFTAVYYEMIDAVGHLVMPYAPPRSPWIGEEDYHRYHRAMDAAYELQDELLGRLLENIDPARTVVMVLSDHGMKSGGERPAGSAEIEGGEAARWHRDPGVLVLAGPGLRRGTVLKEDATLLDIAPTLLSILGLPIPATLPGRVLTGAFDEEGSTRYAPTRVDTVVFRPEVWTPARLPEGGARGGPATAALHNNLGLVLEAKGDLAGAEAEYRLALDAVQNDPNARNNIASVLIKQQRFGPAEEILLRLRGEDPTAIPPAYNLGLLYLRTNRLAEAETAYRAVLAREPGHVKARIDLGHVLLRTGRNSEAEALFEEVIAEAPGEVNAHFGLGLVAAQTGNLERAKEEFRKTLALDPAHASAARNLERLETRTAP
jgi:Flp pilus assembly protein TadD